MASKLSRCVTPHLRPGYTVSAYDVYNHSAQNLQSPVINVISQLTQLHINRDNSEGSNEHDVAKDLRRICTVRPMRIVYCAEELDQLMARYFTIARKIRCLYLNLFPSLLRAKSKDCRLSNVLNYM